MSLTDTPRQPPSLTGSLFSDFTHSHSDSCYDSHFLQVVPLDWKEWLATIAIGLGSWPVSFITRFVSRQIDAYMKKKEAQVRVQWDC